MHVYPLTHHVVYIDLTFIHVTITVPKFVIPYHHKGVHILNRPGVLLTLILIYFRETSPVPDEYGQPQPDTELFDFTGLYHWCKTKTLEECTLVMIIIIFKDLTFLKSVYD